MSSRITSGSMKEPLEVEASTRELVIEMDRVTNKKLIGYLGNKMKEGGVVGIICNTVISAMGLYDMICSSKLDATVLLAHSRFIGKDRMRIDEEVLYYCGPGERKNKNVIVIGTQVLEQSLDIDFDLLISEIASIESFVQRMGRLHRHSRLSRPPSMKKPRMAILEHWEDTRQHKGTVAVYEEWPIIRAQSCFDQNRKTVTLPNDIQSLVEYDPPCSPAFQELKEAYVTSYNKKRKDASHGTVPAPTTNMHSPLTGVKRRQKTDEEIEIAKVRGGKSGPEIITLFMTENGEYYVPSYDSPGNGLAPLLQRDIVTPFGGKMTYETAKKIAAATIRLPESFTDEKYLKCLIDNPNVPSLASWKKFSVFEHNLMVIIFRPVSYGNFTKFETMVLDKRLEYSYNRGLEVRNDKS